MQIERGAFDDEEPGIIQPSKLPPEAVELVGYQELVDAKLIRGSHCPVPQVRLAVGRSCDAVAAMCPGARHLRAQVGSLRY